MPNLRGINTDYAAILDSITAKLGITREELADYRVAVIGAGGTGRTAVAALAHYGATVVVYNRTQERADALAAEFNGKTGKVVAAPHGEALRLAAARSTSTPPRVGMHPNVDASPFGDDPPKLTPDTLVFDTIYNPIETKLLQQAEAAGAKTDQRRRDVRPPGGGPVRGLDREAGARGRDAGGGGGEIVEDRG